MDDATQNLVDEARRLLHEGRMRSRRQLAARGDGSWGEQMLDVLRRLEAAQRPTISPEVRGDVVALIRRVLHPNATRNLPLANEYANHIVDALLARFALPDLDPEKVVDANPCGDWPAPCNCDDPDTHDLTKNGETK